MKRNGTTSSGRQRWRCKSCGSSTTMKYDPEPKRLELFLEWLLSRGRQCDMGMPARTFRQGTAGFWRLWPILPACDEIHHVVYMDGLWIGRDCVLLNSPAPTSSPSAATSPGRRTPRTGAASCRG